MQQAVWPFLLVLALAPAWPANAATETIEPVTAEQPASLVEPPALQPLVDAGKLPPVAERLPETPLVVPTGNGRAEGRSGGEIVTLVTRPKDTRLISVYGYARLVAYDEDFELVADILESVEIEDRRIFTLHLRKGHRWSDGEPFTTEDFRYYWEDVALNEELSPVGPPREMVVGEKLPQVEVIDETTIRYTWEKPNPFFLPALAGALPLYIYRPAHYLKQFHEKYGDPDFIAKQVAEAGARNWAALHNRLDNLYQSDNPDLPVLQPWKNGTYPPAKRFIAERNPYFHRVDAAGMQLPYLDRLILNLTSAALVPAKAGAGESQLQGRGLNFSDSAFLKENEPVGKYGLRLWESVRGSQLALHPNLNASDPVWRKVLRDVRFRRALSLAIDREEINGTLYFGVGLPGNQSALPRSPFYNEELREAWAGFDIEEANRLLDEMGLDKRDSQGIRLLPDGRPAEIVVETAGEDTEEPDVLELISSTWRQIGIKVFIKPSSREVLRNRIFAGECIMAVWMGLENALITPDTIPDEFTPVRQHSYQWPKWGQYYETSGAAGEPVDMPEAEELLDLYHAWVKAPSRDARGDIWRRILEINADQVYTLGLVAKVPHPITVSDRLRNVPEEAVFNWNPGAEFGVHHVDTFWLEQ